MSDSLYVLSFLELFCAFRFPRLLMQMVRTASPFQLHLHVTNSNLVCMHGLFHKIRLCIPGKYPCVDAFALVVSGECYVYTLMLDRVNLLNCVAWIKRAPPSEIHQN